MRVKIRGQDKWINAQEIGVVVELNNFDKARIAEMGPAQSKYYVGPEGEDPDEIE